MHAASVHPEPGSNSLKIYYIRFRVIYFVLELYLSFFYFLSFSQCVLTRFLYTILCSKFCCSIFKDRCAVQAFPVSDFVIILHLFAFVKTFFKTFSSFLKFFDAVTSKKAVLSCGARLVYHFVFCLSRVFSYFFHQNPLFSVLSAKTPKGQPLVW